MPGAAAPAQRRSRGLQGKGEPSIPKEKIPQDLKKKKNLKNKLERGFPGAPDAHLGANPKSLPCLLLSVEEMVREALWREKKHILGRNRGFGH